LGKRRLNFLENERGTSEASWLLRDRKKLGFEEADAIAKEHPHTLRDKPVVDVSTDDFHIARFRQTAS
jgi:hypothetical protein